MTNTKTFSFKEETFKCALHSEVVSFCCLCKHKLCSKCLAEGLHFQSHANVKIVPIKELKRLYMNEIEDLDNILDDLYEGKHLGRQAKSKPMTGSKFNCGEFILKDFSAIKHFSEKLNTLVKNIVSKFFNGIFNEEKEIMKELSLHLEETNGKIINCEQTIDLVNEVEKMKEKAKMCTVRKYEKISLLQSNFLSKKEEFEKEANSLLEKFIWRQQVIDVKGLPTGFEEEKNESGEKKTPDAENSMSNIINSNLKKILNEIDEKSLSKYSKGSKEKSSLIQQSLKSQKSKFSPDKKYSLNSPFHTNQILTLSNSNKRKLLQSVSLWKDEIIQELSNSKLSFSLSYGKKSGQEDNSDKSDNSNNSQNLDNNDSLDISYEKKSIFTELISNNNNNNENRNRIRSLLQKKKNGGNYTQKKSYNGFGTSKSLTNTHGHNHGHKHDKHGKHKRHQNYVTYNNFNNDYNSNTPVIYNQKGNTGKTSGPTQICSECMIIYPVCKSNPPWKKKCLECQKFANNKSNKVKAAQASINNSNNQNYHGYNSYKSGKTNQICGSCKNSFVVPVALLTHRKTCYYCFKGKQNNADKDNSQNA